MQPGSNLKSSSIKLDLSALLCSISHLGKNVSWRSRTRNWRRRLLGCLSRSRPPSRWSPNPARDDAGHVLPYDDAILQDNWPLLRHVHPKQWAPDENRGGYRPTSAAFDFSSAGSKSMSIDIEPPMKEVGIAPTFYAFKVGKGVARTVVRNVRALGFRVGTEPVEDNPYHGGVWLPDPSTKVLSRGDIKRACQQLSRTCEVVAFPPNWKEAKSQ